MSLDSSKISIISAQKVDPNKLITTHQDTNETLAPAGYRKQQQTTDTRCNMCCAVRGALISIVSCLVIAVSATLITIHAEKRVLYSFNGMSRQAFWLAVPGMLVGTTLHVFLSEAMWSGKKNTWGEAWAKAMVVNTAVWCAGIGAGTLLWRKGLPLTSAGRRLYHRYPIPTDPLETRVLRNEKQFFTGMGWSYWLSGVACGQVGLLTAVAFCASNDRPQFLMAPYGGYATACMPRWRRDFIAKKANISEN